MASLFAHLDSFAELDRPLSPETQCNAVKRGSVTLFERAKQELAAKDEYMSADEELQILETIEDSGLPESTKKQIGQLVVEHRVFKRGLLHYANPGNYYQDTVYTYWPHQEDGEEIAIEQCDVGSLARSILLIEDGWPTVPGFGIETAEKLIIPYWPHDPGSLVGTCPPVIPEMFAPLHEDVELEHTKVYDREAPIGITYGKAESK